MAVLSPAMVWSAVLWDDSMLVTTVGRVGPRPTISTGSPTATIPWSTSPVTTAPRPEMVITFSTDIKNGRSRTRTGSGT